MKLRVKKLLLIPLLILVASCCGGCSKPPEKEIKAVESQVNQDGNDSHRAAMQEVYKELEAQENKFPLFRSYEQTKYLLNVISTSVVRGDQLEFSVEPAQKIQDFDPEHRNRRHTYPRIRRIEDKDAICYVLNDDGGISCIARNG